MVIEQDEAEALEEQMFAALRDHNASLLGSLLGMMILTDADVDAVEESGKTAIQAAFEWACPDDMRLMLIDSGADVSAVQSEIAWAAGAAPPRLLRRFLEAGADVNLPSGDVRPLQAASRVGALQSLEMLISAGANVDAGTPHGNPLANAVEYGQAACALSLLAAGAKPEHANRFCPVLGLAAYKGMRDVVEALLEAGDDPNVRISLREGHDVVDELSLVFETMFDEPVDRGDTSTNGGSEPPLRYADATPLIVAAGEGHTDLVRVLLGHGADIAATDAEGKTAYQVAERRHQLPALIALLDGGADPHPEETALRHLLRAAERGDIWQVRVLLRQGADPKVAHVWATTDGQTALMLAAGHGHADVVGALLAAGANASACDNEQRTALHYAAAAGHVEVARTLIRAGAACEAADAHGETPMTLALAHGDEAMRELIAAELPAPEPVPADPVESAPVPEMSAEAEAVPVKKPARKKAAGKKTAKKKATSKKAVAKKKPASKKATAKKAAGKKAAVKKAASKAAPKKKAAATKKTATKKTATKKATKKATAAKKSPAKKATKKRASRSGTTRKKTAR